MDSAYIVAAIPFFFLLIGIEYAIARKLRRPYFHLHDSLASLSCGIVQQMSSILLKLVLLGGYIWVYEHWRWIEPIKNPWVLWIGTFILVDLLYFLFHWSSHRVNIIWATHVVHHQSEHYNLSTALRQSAFQGVMSAPFFLPLAILGVPPLVFFTCVTLNTLYQFWIHTQLIGRMGPLEWILNTPSHHRVHHGIDPQYVDRNYAGVFIIWDKLFQTFEPERAPVHYGTVKGFHSWNPIWANFDEVLSIARLSWKAKTWKERAYAWVAPPEWRPASLGGKVTVQEVAPGRRIWDTHGYHGSELYVLTQFPVVTLAVMFILAYQSRLPGPVLGAGIGWIFLSVLSWAGIGERKAWAPPLEFFRLAVFPALVLWATWKDVPSVGFIALAGVLSLVSLLYLRRNLVKDRPALP